jgi:hypothetical protein
MKQLFSLLLILIVSTLYSQPATTTDRYFIETRDTISMFGPMSITRNILEDKKG